MHDAKTRQNIARFILLYPNNSEGEVVAVYIEDPCINQALRQLTNVEDSGQSNEVMFLKDPDFVTRISELALK
uniref:DUF1330 domain-containing protein n=1 Tax=Rhabditophanes sp. KR3021 TaxID=114890 RepID=A0AC35TTR0_9BILA